MHGSESRSESAHELPQIFQLTSVSTNVTFNEQYVKDVKQPAMDLASPSSASTRFEEHDSEWQYGPRTAKRRKQASTTGASRPSPREIGFMRESQNDGSASFLGSSSGIHFIRHVYDAFARRSADLQENRARDRSSVPGEDDRLRGSGTTHDTDELWTREEVDHAPNPTFSFEDLVNWTRRYFENWHPIFPCLHAPTALKTMEILGGQGIRSIRWLDLIVIRSIISISLADSRQIGVPGSKIGPVPATLVFQNVHHVMHDIQSLLSEPTTIPLLQAAFTAQLALTSLLRLNAASRVGGVITRTAFHLGLHRCPGRFSCFSSEEVDIRRRLFWSIYCLERYLSQALGIPLSIRDDDIDVCYPGEERHVSRAPKSPDDHRLRLLCHLAKFARIRGLILELRNKSILHSHAGSVEASHVNGELAEWWNEVYDDVNPLEENDRSEEQGQALSPYHRLLLTILRHEAIISMNRPLLAAENQSPDYKNALQTCIVSSRSLLTALKRYMASPSDAPLAWSSFTWATWMACLILMYASWEGEFPVPTALKYSRMGTSVLENLAQRGCSWPETCIEAIRSMESALSENQPSRQHESAPNGGRIVHHDSASATGQNGQVNVAPAQNTRRQSKALTPISAPSDKQRAIDYEGYPIEAAQLETPRTSTGIRGIDPGQPYDAAAFSPQNAGNRFDLPTSDGLLMNGQTSAGLIFGNMAGTNTPFPGQDSLPFSDPSSLLMGDLWSVADGPWLIHGNFM